MNLKKLGIWASTESFTATEAAWFARPVEVRARIQAHWDAGADHVCIQAQGGREGGRFPDEALRERLAPGAA